MIRGFDRHERRPTAMMNDGQTMSQICSLCVKSAASRNIPMPTAMMRRPTRERMLFLLLCEVVCGGRKNDERFAVLYLLRDRNGRRAVVFLRSDRRGVLVRHRQRDGPAFVLELFLIQGFYFVDAFGRLG